MSRRIPLVEQEDRWISLSIGNRTLLALGIVSFVFYLVGHAYYLGEYPLVNVDEAWYADPAWTFMTKGHFGGSMFRGLARPGESNVAFGRLFLLSEAAVFAVGGLGYVQARVPHLIFGLLTLGVTYLLGRDLYNRFVGGLAAALLGISTTFIWFSHHARPEMLLTFMFTLALYLCFRARQADSTRLYALSGLVSGLAFDVHLTGILLGLAVGGWVIVTHLPDFYRSRQFWAYAAGGAVALGYWVVVHILIHPDLFVEQWTRYWGVIHGPPIEQTLNPIELLSMEAMRYVSHFWGPSYHYKMVPFVIFVLALGFAVWRRDDRSDRLLFALGAYVLGFALVVNNKTAIYTVYFYPIFMIFVGRLVYRLLRDDAKLELGDRIRVAIRPTAKALLALALVFSLSGFYVAADGYVLYSADQKPTDYGEFTARIDADIPDDAIVTGSPTYWYRFHDQGYYATHYFAAVDTSPALAGELNGNYAQAMRDAGVDYIIVDSLFRQKVQSGFLPTEDVQRFLAENATVVATINESYYGSTNPTGTEFQGIRIYKVTNESEKTPD